MSGPDVVTDIIDVYVFRRAPGVELLQLRRARMPMAGSWQPVMGRIEEGERAEEAAVRELGEETGLKAGDAALVGLWRLDRVHPYYMAERGAIVLSVRFACEARAEWEPVLNEEHDGARWVKLEDVGEAFLWPGQRASILDLEEGVLRGSACGDALRVEIGRTARSPKGQIAKEERDW